MIGTIPLECVEHIVDEALAAVHDLVNPQIGGNSRRWASWFLEVADEQGGFFRTSLGYPAHELVTEDRAEQPAPIPTAIRSAAFAAFQGI